MIKDTWFIGPIIVVFGMILLLGAYFVAYFVLVFPKYEPHTGSSSAHYRFGGILARRVFGPVHAVDRQIRPGTWPDGDWNFVVPTGLPNEPEFSSDELSDVELPDFILEPTGRIPGPS